MRKKKNMNPDRDCNCRTSVIITLRHITAANIGAGYTNLVEYIDNVEYTKKKLILAHTEFYFMMQLKMVRGGV